MEEKNKTLTEEIDKFKEKGEWNDTTGLIALVLVSSLFSDWGSKSKTEELEKRISKLEAKNEIIEKVLF